MTSIIYVLTDSDLVKCPPEYTNDVSRTPLSFLICHGSACESLKGDPYGSAFTALKALLQFLVLL